MQKLIKIDPLDNVAVALRDVDKGQSLDLDCRFIIVQ